MIKVVIVLVKLIASIFGIINLIANAMVSVILWDSSYLFVIDQTIDNIWKKSKK